MTTAAVPSRPEERITLEGELTIYTVAETFGRLRVELEGRRVCALDLSAVSEIDGAGLQLLLWVKQASEARGADFSLVAHSDAVADVIALLQLEPRFGMAPVQPNQEDVA
ncbi:STAS domain-containing protein [Thiocystis violacea]|uniref:STAS domain-containing protein n=1 Tax=Thiocystis violacea TaxID=13725 RepID=UPI001907AB79|nr:STAS domain-containing protein [Thiocystis violacea]MBK1721347.1 hypothetical protein [Thiocystis violacea]